MNIVKAIAGVIFPLFFILGLGATILFILVKVNGGEIGFEFAVGGVLLIVFGVVGTSYSQGWNKAKTVGALVFHLF